MAKSSSAICDGPSSPIETPTCEPAHFMLANETAPIRSWSVARVKNAAKVLKKVLSQ